MGSSVSPFSPILGYNLTIKPTPVNTFIFIAGNGRAAGNVKPQRIDTEHRRQANDNAVELLVIDQLSYSNTYFL